jgi:arginine decarboxylase-like protein
MPIGIVIDIIDPDESVAEKVFTTYFRNDESNHTKDLKPYIAQAVREIRQATPPLDQENIVSKFENGGVNLRNEKDVDQLNNLIIKAIDKAFAHREEEDRKKWSHKQAALMTSGATLISTLVTALSFAYSNRNSL